MKRTFAMLLVAMLVLTTGCGKHVEETPKTESGAVADKTEDESGYGKELAAIEESKLTAPKKVAALSANAAAMWKLAGGEISAGVEEVSGVPKDCICGTEEEPDIEAVLFLEPDLVLVDKKAGNYGEILSYLDMTEDAPPYISAEIRSFDDYADCMLEMAKYTKDTEAYRSHVIDVRRKNADVIARGREALKVLIQTMPLPESEFFDESMAGRPETAGGAEASAAAGTSTDSGVAAGADDSSPESGEESVPADPEKIASVREAVTVLVLRADKDSCTIEGSCDYVSNMLADFGLVNVNPDAFTVTASLPKESDKEVSPKADSRTDPKADTASVPTASGLDTGSEVTISGAVTSQGSEENPAAGAAVSEAAAGTEAGAGAAVSEAAEGTEAAAGAEEYDKILNRNPDYIFVIYEGKAKEAEKAYKKICESKEYWSEMTAVKNRHVYTLPQSTFAAPPNAQWDLAYEYLYQTMFVM